MKITLLILFILFTVQQLSAQEKTAPHFEEYYFLSKKGEKIEGSVSVGQKKVYLLIISSNAHGEKVILTMDKDENYFYKRTLLLGGTSVKFPIKKDVEKIKLVIFNPDKKRHVKKQKNAEEAK